MDMLAIIKKTNNEHTDLQANSFSIDLQFLKMHNKLQVFRKITAYAAVPSFLVKVTIQNQTNPSFCHVKR